MSSSEAPRRESRWSGAQKLLAGALAVALLVGAAGGAYVLSKRRPGDVVNTAVPFELEPPPTTPKPERIKSFSWPVYGYTKARTRFLAEVQDVDPPLEQRWIVRGRTLLEFSPVLSDGLLFQLGNDGILKAIVARTGSVRWKRDLGYLAAASPAVAGDTVYAVVLERERGVRAGRVVALSAKSGRQRWSRPLPSRIESSPVVDGESLYFGSEDGTVYSLNTRNGRTRWTYRAAGAVKGGPALRAGRLYFGDYGGRVHAIRARDGSRVWSVGGSGANYYSTPAVAFGRVYIGNTDGRVYSFSTRDGALAWAKQTGGFVYSSPAVGDVRGLGPTVYAGSYSGRFYAFDARNGDIRWSHNAGGRISGGATVIGDVVYFANLGAKTTVGLDTKTGRGRFKFRKGAFNPVISDGRRIYLTGYASLYAFVAR